MDSKILIDVLQKHDITTLGDLLDILDCSFDAIILSDKNDVIIYASKAIERISGVSRDRIVGKTTEQLIDEGLILSQSIKKIERGLANINHVLQTGITAFITSSKVFQKDNRDEFLFFSNYREINELQDLADELKEMSRKSDHYHKELMELRGKSAMDGIIARSKSMEKLIKIIKKIAYSDITVNITGESGVGKNVIARLIHELSERKNGPYIHINCGAIPENLIESELFGYEKGAFSGASERGKPGLLEIAHEGTVFLDEIADLPLNMQVKLLKVLEDQQIYRVGSTKSFTINIRIICASNKNMEDLIDSGSFRRDLYFRVNQFPVRIPPLRERGEEIVHFCHYFLEKYNGKYDTNKSISTDVLKMLESYNWPGNVRELENMIERLVLISDKNKIGIKDLPGNIIESSYSIGMTKNLKDYMEEFEEKILIRAIDKYGSRKAAKKLGIHYSTLKRKINKYAIH